MPVRVDRCALKFCFFRTPPSIPPSVSGTPKYFGFEDGDLDKLKTGCGGSALYGVSQIQHPLYEQAFVCENHKAKKFFSIWGPPLLGDQYKITDRVPSIQQLLKQGGGGDPRLEEGKVQDNKANCARYKQKKNEVGAAMVTKIGELTVELQTAQTEIITLQEQLAQVKGDHGQAMNRQTLVYQHQLSQLTSENQQQGHRIQFLEHQNQLFIQELAKANERI